MVLKEISERITGCDTGILPSMGAPVRSPVPSVALDIKKILVSPPTTALVIKSLTADRISLFFGNTLYLAAFGYYFVVSFLGYNGMFTLFSTTHLVFSHTNILSSPTLPQSYQTSPIAISCMWRSLVRQPVRLQYSTAFWADTRDRGRHSVTYKVLCLSSI